ncbi:MAG TPA: hypothetical protein VGC55_06865, partial [Dokdonella sp.]
MAERRAARTACRASEGAGDGRAGVPRRLPGKKKERLPPQGKISRKVHVPMSSDLLIGIHAVEAALNHDVANLVELYI